MEEYCERLLNLKTEVDRRDLAQPDGADDHLLTRSMRYPVHIGDSQTTICSIILRHLIDSNSGFQV